MDITSTIVVPDEELEWAFARSGGPGGQNVNKVASKAVLRWHLEANITLPADVKDRLRSQQRNRITAEGTLVLQSQRFRDQPRNIEDCRAKLRDMVLRALLAPKARKATRPGRGARERRLAEKRQQAKRKAGRRKPADE